MRAAMFARYFSDLQSASSIEDQIRLCRERIEADGDVLAEVYTDYAISGGSLKARAGMQALLADAQAKRFDSRQPSDALETVLRSLSVAYPQARDVMSQMGRQPDGLPARSMANGPTTGWSGRATSTAAI